ncbi:Tyrosine-type recombinase/integrase [Sulfidibacter corallicola]
MEQGLIRLPGTIPDQENRSPEAFRGTKNGCDHIVPLSSYPLDLLKRLHQNRTSTNPYVLPGVHHANKPISRTKQLFPVIADLVGSPFSPHATRRTFASIANEVGLGFLKVKRLLNHHFEGGVTGGYISPNFNPTKERVHFQKVCDFILERRAEYLGAIKRESVTFDKTKALRKLQRYALELGLEPVEALHMLTSQSERIGEVA